MHLASIMGVSRVLIRANSRLLRLHFFFFNHTATTEIYTLSLHDALPISASPGGERRGRGAALRTWRFWSVSAPFRSEEHTSELQSLTNLVCRLLLEKKKLVKLDSLAQCERVSRNICGCYSHDPPIFL